MSEAIVITDMKKVFRGKRGARVAALRGISFAVEQGEIFGFLGPNGAGKSTTIKCLMGLIAPSSGQATIGGEVAGSLAARKKIGYLPENPAFYDYLTAQEYLTFVGKVCGLSSETVARRSAEVLQELELWDARNRPIRSYSKGMVQRLGLAQALVHNPDILIFDEPMSGLDPLGRALVKTKILELKAQGKTIFFSTHIIDDVEKICDRVAIILGGEVKFVGRVDRIVREGITGYQVRIRRGADGSVHDETIDKSGLSSFLDQVRTAGDEVLLVEPHRRHLEDFFLAMVRENLQGNPPSTNLPPPTVR